MKLQDDNFDPKKSGFIIPENYFEELEKSVMKKTSTPTNIISLNRKLLSLASSLLLIMGISWIIYFVVSNNKSIENTKYFAEIANKDSHIVLPKTITHFKEIDQASNSEESINNEFLDFAEELNLNDEELLELIEISDI